MVSKLPLRASLCQAPCPLPRVVQAVCHSPKCGIDFPLTRSAAYPYGGRSTCSYLSEQKRQRSEKLTAIQHFCPGKMRRPIRVAESTLAFPCAARVRGSRDHWSLAAFLSHLSFRWWKERWPSETPHLSAESAEAITAGPPEAEQAIGIAGRRKRRPLQRPPCELRGRAAFPHISPQDHPAGWSFHLPQTANAPPAKRRKGPDALIRPPVTSPLPTRLFDRILCILTEMSKMP